MTTYLFQNFAEARLKQTLSVSSTSLELDSSDAALFPQANSSEQTVFRAVLFDGNQAPEIVECTANPHTGTLSIQRAMENTTATEWPAGTKLRLTQTAGMLAVSHFRGYDGADALRQVIPVQDQYYWLKFLSTLGDVQGGLFRAATGAAPGTYVDDSINVLVPAGGDGSVAFLRESFVSNPVWAQNFKGAWKASTYHKHDLVVDANDDFGNGSGLVYLCLENGLASSAPAAELAAGSWAIWQMDSMEIGLLQENATLSLPDKFRVLTASGYKRVPAAALGTIRVPSSTLRNTMQPSVYNSISDDVHSSHILSSAQNGFPNVIGSVAGTGANHAAILAGYDNRIDCLSGVIIGDHNTIERGTGQAHRWQLGGARCTINDGNYTLAVGGYYNTHEGTCSATVSGQQCVTRGSFSFVGSSNTVVCAVGASYGVAISCQNVNLDNTRPVAIGTLNSDVTAQYGVAIGLNAGAVTHEYSAASGRGAKTRFGGSRWYASGYIAASGDSQVFLTHGYQQTTLAATYYLRPGGGSGGHRMFLEDNTARAFSALVTARCQATGESGAWRVEGCIKRGANAAATEIVGAPVVTALGSDFALATVGAAADTSFGELLITVTGEAKTIRWSARITGSDVIY